MTQTLNFEFIKIALNALEVQFGFIKRYMCILWNQSLSSQRVDHNILLADSSSSSFTRMKANSLGDFKYRIYLRF